MCSSGPGSAPLFPIHCPRLKDGKSECRTILATCCQTRVPCCAWDPAGNEGHVLQCGGATYSPAAHGRWVAPAAGVEGGLAGVATRGVEARVEAGVGERACSWTEVAPIDIVWCLRWRSQRMALCTGCSRHRNSQVTLHWKQFLKGGVTTEETGFKQHKLQFHETIALIPSIKEVKMSNLSIKQVNFS